MDPRSNAARVVRRDTRLAVLCLALSELEAGNTMSAMEVLHTAVKRELVPIYQAGRILMAPGVDPAEVHGLLLAWSWGNDPDTEFIRVRVAETAMESLNRQVDFFVCFPKPPILSPCQGHRNIGIISKQRT